MNQQRVNVAIIGLGFGSEFIPIYQNHPQGEYVRHLPAKRRAAGQHRRDVRRGKTLHLLR